MGNVKVVLIKGKYQYKRQLALYQDKAIAYGPIKAIAYGPISDAIKKLNPVLINSVLTKKTPGDTHYIIMEE